MGERDDHLVELRNLAVGSKSSGAQIHDARIAAICLQHGVSELWSADRDFQKYPKLRMVNPLVAQRHIICPHPPLEQPTVNCPSVVLKLKQAGFVFVTLNESE